jgi:hypothetical protein
MMADPAPYITAFHRKSAGFKPDLKYVDFISAFKQDADMVEKARSELSALRIRGAGRDDFKGDHEGKIREQALSRMLDQFDGKKDS